MIFNTNKNQSVTFLNLQQQVQKNKEDIARHYAIDRALTNFGIKVVGRANTEQDLPNPETYAGTYGDAYAVGAEAPYTYYIFTRPDPNQGIATSYWLDVGQISVQGPEGPQGPQGPAGVPGTSTRWYFGSTVPTLSANDGDIFLISSGASFGDIYGYTGQTWVYLGNIKGPQGIQGIQGQRGLQGIQGPEGPQGPQGPSGQSFHIEGVVDTPAQLPTPTQEIRAGAYLVGTAAPYDMYIIEGGHDEGDLLLWINAGNITSIPGIPGPQGAQGVAGKDGFSIYRSTATSKLGDTVPVSSIVNPDGRELKVGDLVLFKTVIHVITAINTNTITLSTTGTHIEGPVGEQGPQGPAGSNITYYNAYMTTIYGYNYYRFFIPKPIVNGSQRVILKGLYSYQQVDNDGFDYKYDDLIPVEYILYDGNNWTQSFTMNYHYYYNGTRYDNSVNVVLTEDDGCYIYTLETTDNISGTPILEISL